MNKELIPIEELIKEIENNKYIDCDEVDKYEEIYEYASILYYLKKYIRLNNIINELEEWYVQKWNKLMEFKKDKFYNVDYAKGLSDGYYKLKELKENKNG